MPSHEKNSTELEQVEHVRTEDADNFQTEEDALPAGYFRSSFFVGTMAAVGLGLF